MDHFFLNLCREFNSWSAFGNKASRTAYAVVIAILALWAAFRIIDLPLLDLPIRVILALKSTLVIAGVVIALH